MPVSPLVSDMCGRTSLFAPQHVVEERFDATAARPLDARYNIAPQDPIPAVLDEDPATIRRPDWGLVPHWASDPDPGTGLVNARAETVHEKPAFRDAFENRRCLVVADGYYEWQETRGGKQPYRVAREDDAPFAFAGLWERHETANGARTTVAVVTTQPNDLVAPIHDRMPAVLDADDEGTWLGTDDPDAARDVLGPADPAGWRAYPVSTAVNDPHSDGPELIDAVDPGDDEQAGLDDFGFHD